LVDCEGPLIPGAVDQGLQIDPQVVLAALLAKSRGKEYPAPNAPEKSKADYITKLHGTGESDALARYRQATHNLLYYSGRQWIDWHKSERTWKDLPNPAGEPRSTLNYIEPILHSRIARLTSSSLSWRVIPETNSYEEKDRGKVAVDFLNATWKRTDMDFKVQRSLLIAFCAGVMAFKSFWNRDIGRATSATKFFPQPPLVEQDELGQPKITPQQPVEQYVDIDGNPVESEELAAKIRPGDTDTAVRTVFNLRLNPEAQGWTVSEGLRWCIDSEVVPIATARELFPNIAERISPLDSNESSLTYERIAQGTIRGGTSTSANPYVGKQSSGGVTQGEMAVIREYWEMPCDYFKEGRLILSVGGAVAYDGKFPDGIFPYAPLFDTPGTLTPYGRASVNTMVSPQNVINRQWSAIVAQGDADGIGRYVSWAIPGVPDQITSGSNRVIQVPMRTAAANRPISDIFQRLQPGQVSPDRWQLIAEAKTALFDVGAFHEVTRGQIPPGVDSGVAIERLLESEAGSLKGSVDALKRTHLTWARHQLTIAKRNYGADETRWIPVDRPDLEYMVESVTGEKLPDPETITLDLENFRPQSEAAMRAEVKELMQLQVLDPRQGLKMMDMGRGLDAAFQSQTRHYSRARKENLCFQRGDLQAVPQGLPEEKLPPAFVHPEDGSPFLLPQDDDHAIHIDVHNEVALDDSQPWPVRQAVLIHISEHRQAAMVQGQQAAAAQIQAQGALAKATDTKAPTKEPASSGSKAAEAADVNVEKGAVQVTIQMPKTKKTITTPSGAVYHVTEEPEEQTVTADNE
jgi:hypothetical protein